MITALDTNVLLDVLRPDPVFGPSSASAIRSALADGNLRACDVVWTEIAGVFHSSAAAETAMGRLGLEFSATMPETAFEAGLAWRVYRSRGGVRSWVAADFLIGAHALCQADRLPTRDRGFYRAYFKRLPILDPSR